MSNASKSGGCPGGTPGGSIPVGLSYITVKLERSLISAKFAYFKWNSFTRNFECLNIEGIKEKMLLLAIINVKEWRMFFLCCMFVCAFVHANLRNSLTDLIAFFTNCL